MLVHGDSFDVYGTTSSLMSQGIYTTVTDITLSAAHPRTGTYSVLSGTNAFLRYSVTSGNGFAVGAAFRIETLPTANQAMGLGSFRDATNTNQISLWVKTDGSVEARAGDWNGTVLGTSTPFIVAATYHYIEIWVRCDSSDGFVRLGYRNQGGTDRFAEVLSLSNINTDTTGTGEISYVSPFNRRTANASIFYCDDLAIYNNMGSYNNEPFIGDSVVIVMSPNADTANADWAKSTGALGYALVNGVPPNDSAYISTATPNATSRFDMSDVSTALYRVRGVVCYSRQQKSGAGTTSNQISIKRGTLFNPGTARDVTTSWVYYKDLFELDPATAGPWTPTTLNLASIQIKKI